ncbi:MAG: FAD-binding oxidoreductase, partial [Armatimonadetes bacterium]|nr:FAD-binding oxidoreductase [Armatimonadota bacterium]
MTTLQQRFPDQKPEELFVPEIAKITRAENLTEQDRIFEIELPGGKDLGHKPGQFVEVSIFGFGEAPISITSSPAKKGSFELCVRKLGGLT